VEPEHTKPLSEWRADIQRHGRKHWLVFYKAMLDQAVSSSSRFYKALSLYGDWAIFESIVASSNAQLTGDKLNYVIKVAANKWKEMQLDEEQEEAYQKEIREAIRISQEKNQELARKLRKKL
jgi:hypothetical protein